MVTNTHCSLKAHVDAFMIPAASAPSWRSSASKSRATATAELEGIMFANILSQRLRKCTVRKSSDAVKRRSGEQFNRLIKNKEYISNIPYSYFFISLRNRSPLRRFAAISLPGLTDQFIMSHRSVTTRVSPLPTSMATASASKTVISILHNPEMF